MKIKRYGFGRDYLGREYAGKPALTEQPEGEFVLLEDHQRLMQAATAHADWMMARAQKAESVQSIAPTDIARICFDDEIRVEKIICMGANNGDELPDLLQDFINYEIGDIDYPLFSVPFPQWGPDDDDLPEEFQFMDWIRDNRLFGFLIEVATPVIDPKTIKYNEDGTWSSFSRSWGRYTLRWFYAASFNEAFTQGADWADQYQNNILENKRLVK